MKRVFRIGWGCWTLLVFVLGASLAVLAVAVLPGLERRRRVARAAARGIFRAAGIPVAVNGLACVPASASIVCANHASYVDGVLMQAVLPPRFAFVVKREAARVPLAGLLLRRIGTEFVDRFNAREGAADTARIVRHSGGGNSMCVFPEGTFHPERGLRRFRMGAFYAATRGNLPIVPAAITGTREMLPAGSWLPRPFALTVTFAGPMYSTTRGREAAHALCTAVRERIIRDCGEHCAQELD